MPWSGAIACGVAVAYRGLGIGAHSTLPDAMCCSAAVWYNDNMLLDEAGLLDELDRHRRSVDTDYFDLSLRELVRMVSEQEIKIAPAYQRQFRWDDETQSALIESFLLGLPVPAIFVATNRDATWDVVDGLQRICTILRFMGVDAPESEKFRFSVTPLRLKSLKTLVGFGDLTYEELPRPIRMTLDRRFLRVQVLSDKSEPEVRFELFRRLNAGAVALTPQEIRSCIFRGPFHELLEELSQSAKFASLLKLQKLNQTNGTAEELVLKFFAYLDRSSEFDGKVTNFLNSYMRDRASDSDLVADREIFEKSVDFLSSIISGPFLRGKLSITPLNQFEAVLVAVGSLFRKGVDPRIPPSGWLNDEKLVNFSTGATNTRAMLISRIGRAEELMS
ncbi:DUF262 domain-containing protein [Streptomyces olivaceus]|uniref:GmrSD restriction endonuclease domain-containing protein n=1 Tax=Streptomyces olivaceus TaxID=47716 RepID=UPI0018A867C6|nr:DUF262 domain-containing protein [Streptomyces olivaceus]MBF8172782.1 DUF262 domain-containing protein [Streptomyces olivaceus]